MMMPTIGRNFKFVTRSPCLQFGKTLIRQFCNSTTERRTSNIVSATILKRVPPVETNFIDMHLFPHHRQDLGYIPRPTPVLRIESPSSILRNEIYEIPKYSNVIGTPSKTIVNDTVHAARLVVIRKRKMKKHKLKKLRKKMKFEWAKVRQRREMRKEKSFQAELIAKVKEAEKFTAENYVHQKLKEANEMHIPRFWKGKRLPQFIIRQKLGLK